MNYNPPIVRRVEALEIYAARESARKVAEEYGWVNASWMEVGGGVAVFEGVGSPLTHVVGPWVTAPVSAGDFDQIERFYGERDCPVNIEYSTLADPAALELLASRGYRLVEINHVLAREIPGAIPESWLDPRVRVSKPEELELWARTMVSGFLDRSELSREEALMGQAIAAIPDCLPWLVEVRGEPVAAGAMIALNGAALFFCDSTLRGARGAGLQSLLIWSRLREAASRGCDLAAASTLPGSQSQRNYERFGFRVAYTRLNFQKG